MLEKDVKCAAFCKVPQLYDSLAWCLSTFETSQYVRLSIQVAARLLRIWFSFNILSFHVLLY